ncbi:MAG TPA: hypothetical protein VK656_04795 [Candidatus Acidoferrum sp.]|nr:hypothetical protein [Candidatus Acidoferrum sp.]
MARRLRKAMVGMRSGGVVLVAVAMLIGGCNPTAQPSIGSTPPTSPSVAGSGQSASPIASATTSPTPATSPRTATGLVTFPASAVRSASVDAWTALGSRVFSFDGPKQTSARRISMTDLATGTSTFIAKTHAGHMVEAEAATTDRIVWLETWRDHPGPPTTAVPGCVDVGKPLRWQIYAAEIATGVESVVAAGTDVRTAVGGECADVDRPLLAADGDRVAYTLEEPSKAHPLANQIVVRSLTDGVSIRTIDTAGLAEDLRISGQVVAYRDNVPPDPSVDTVDPFDGRLMLALSDGQAPTRVDDHTSDVGLSAGRIAWTRTDANDGSVWTEPLSASAPTKLTLVPVPGFKPDTATEISVADDAVAWTSNGTDDQDVGISRPAIWTTAGVGPGLLEGVELIDVMALGGGWLVWSSGGAHAIQVVAVGGY